MSLLSGLEKFGFSDDDDLDLFAEEPKKSTRKRAEAKKVVDPVLLEQDLLLTKTVECPVCGQKFEVKAVRNTKLKRLEPDFDLRPNFENIDTLKYDVLSCHHCGYTAMTRFFDHITPGQRKMIKEAVCSKFTPMEQPADETYSYEFAIERYKLALVNAMARKAKISEKAYICLKIAWIRRTETETLKPKTDEEKAYLANSKSEFQAFYKQAYEGFMKAMEKESPPYCGMDTSTVEFMVANMSMYFKEYDTASKLVARLITTPGTPSRIKDKCLDMKTEILANIKKQK